MSAGESGDMTRAKAFSRVHVGKVWMVARMKELKVDGTCHATRITGEYEANLVSLPAFVTSLPQ